MGQLPTTDSPESQALKTPIVVTCDNGQGGTGPSAGGEFSHIAEGEIIRQREEVWIRGVKQPGYIYEFVIFHGPYGAKRVAKPVAVYVKSMIAAAKADKVTLRVTSGFRTYAKQAELYKKFLIKKQPPTAKAGRSKHQSGIAVDFNVHMDKGAYEWMVKNAYRFGFVRTVPRERWHWEYRGSWPGQEKPDWASAELGMFSVIPRYHACGTVPSIGGIGWSSPMSRNYWWNTRYRPHLKKHTDSDTRGRTNTWIGDCNEHLPDKFDRDDPGWDKRGPSV